jgi:hypothetical protein
MFGCGAGGKTVQNDLVKPGDLERMITTDFAADGQVHVLSVGKFVIKPETYFCTYRPGFGFDGARLRDALKALGQSDYLNGSPRTNGTFGPQGLSEGCSDGTQIFIRVFQSVNRNGSPYKLVLSVYQGTNAAWVAKVERLDGLRPGARSTWRTPPPSEEEKRLIRTKESIQFDIKEISDKFLKGLT